MNQFKFGIIVAILFFIGNSFAAKNDIYFNKLNLCTLSKAELNDYEPTKFKSTNNLLKQTGQLENYSGEKIIIYGRVLDQNCVPVSDAILYAWQVNNNSKYPYKPLKDFIDEDLIEINKEDSFTGNGIATTNNKGEFYFLTIYPNSVHKKSSHINIRVNHHRLGPLQTILTLKGHKVSDPKLIPELNLFSQISFEDEVDIYKFDIVLPGVALKSY